MFDLSAITEAVSRHGAVTRVVIANAEGSTPREAGASMLVWNTGQSGTIGGGTLEYEAAARARNMLGESRRFIKTEPLGPALGQCCGGAMMLAYESFTVETLPTPQQNRLVGFADTPCPDTLTRLMQRHEQAAKPVPVTCAHGWMTEPCVDTPLPVWIFGGGHVGRAVASCLAPLPDFAVKLIDMSVDRLPNPMPTGVYPVLAVNPVDLLTHAPKEAQFYIMTHSHTLDLDLCHGLLNCGAQRVGLIGSATKWSRFRKRLTELGHITTEVSRITCPIGDPTLGKHPQAIAISIATTLLKTEKMTNATKDVA
ncbi:MAG: xanthine dehydrogenase accessory protein XdhC [Pseudoruegeria sp.]